MFEAAGRRGASASFLWLSITMSALLVAGTLARCAVATLGPMQRIDVHSEPPGASVDVRDCGAGSRGAAKTPGSVFVARHVERCMLIFTLAGYGSRSVALLRIESSGAPLDLINPPGTELIHGAPYYQQTPSVVSVDFTEPLPPIAGRYRLVSVNGHDLPAPTWTASESCVILTDSGELAFDESGRWESKVVEQRTCGENRSPMRIRNERGVFTLRRDELFLESEEELIIASVLGDAIEIRVKGEGRRRGQEAIYRYERER